MALAVRNLNGWQRDELDHRDHYLLLPLHALKALPPSYDMRPMSPPIYDQKQLGSCTSQAVARALQFTEKEMAPGKKRPVPSRLFIYWNTRSLQGNTAEDTGASLRNSIKSVATNGYCRESLWIYNIEKFAEKPSEAAFNSAAVHKLQSLHYARVSQNLDAMRAVLADQNPIIFGFTVYPSFDKARKGGIVPVPMKSEKKDGGHAMTIVGYDDAKKVFICANSWGTRWGDKGYCYMSYQHLTNPDMAADFWTVKALPAIEEAG